MTLCFSSPTSLPTPHNSSPHVRPRPFPCRHPYNGHHSCTYHGRCCCNLARRAYLVTLWSLELIDLALLHPSAQRALTTPRKCMSIVGFLWPTSASMAGGTLPTCWHGYAKAALAGQRLNTAWLAATRRPQTGRGLAINGYVKGRPWPLKCCGTHRSPQAHQMHKWRNVLHRPTRG